MEPLFPALQSVLGASDIVRLSALEKSATNNLLIERFPFSGSFPNWSVTKNHQSTYQPVGSLVEAHFADFFAACLMGRPDDLMYYLNDGVDLAFKGMRTAFQTNLAALVDVPHTSYFIATNGSWCMTLRMNGQMDWGESMVWG